MVQDLRYALRLLARNPLFALTAIVSLAIGIGANTTIFTIANALLLRPPSGAADPARLVDIGRTQDGRGFDNGSYPNYLDLRTRNTVFEGVYAYRFGAEPLSLGSPDGAEPIFGNMVTLNYFAILGTRPRIGRLFAATDDEHPGAAPVVVLSYAFWKRRFNSDPSMVGRALTLNGRPFTVVGVAPEGFHGTSVLTGDVWVPMTMVGELSPRLSESILRSRLSAWLLMGARLKRGVTLPQAQAEVATLGQQLEREFPLDNRGRGLRVDALSPVPGNSAPVVAFMAVLAGIVTLVLAIACANVAGVLLARAASRRRELAVRVAIGAGRLRLVRQLLIESMVLFLIGGAAGFALAHAMTSLMVSLLPALPVPIDLSLPLDARAVVFTISVSLVAAVLTGLAPAIDASRSAVIGALKDDGTGGRTRQRLRNTFVVGQVAFSIVLVVAASLFGRALQRASHIDPGFDVNGIELAGLDLSLAGYAEQNGRVFASTLIQRVLGLPGVESAALAAMVPLGGGGLGLGGLTVPGVAPPNGRRFLSADWNVVTPGYFAAMKMRLLSGRDFTDADGETAPAVAIVNATAVRQWWGGRDPVGKTLLQEAGTRANPDATRQLTVIAVAADANYRTLGEDPRPFVYVPIAQQYLPRVTIMARANHGQRLAGDLRRLIAALDPNLPIVSTQTFAEYAAVGLVPQRVAASVAGSLGLVGLLLAAFGIYGVTASVVASRRREIGVRMALGATAADIGRIVLRHGAALAAIGLAIGFGLAAAASRVIASFLLGVSPGDVVSFAWAGALFAAATLAACFVPARRAARLDPVDALRHD